MLRLKHSGIFADASLVMLFDIADLYIHGVFVCFKKRGLQYP